MGTSKAFTFNNVRIVFPKLLKAGPKYGGVGEEYSTVALIPKADAAQIQRFQAVYNELANGEFGTIPGNLRAFMGNDQRAVLKDGDDKYNAAAPEKKGNYEAYRGHMVIQLSKDIADGRIQVIDLDRNDIISVDQAPAGSFAHIVVECSCYKSVKFGPQFSVRPQLVQIVDSSQPIVAVGMDKDTAMSMLPGQQNMQPAQPQPAQNFGAGGVPQQPANPKLDELM